MQSRLIWNELGNTVTEVVAHVHSTPHVANHRACGHGAESCNLADRIAPVALLDVINHTVAIGLAEIHVKVWHGHTLGIQEALKQQVVVDRIQIGDLQDIRHQRTCTRTTAWPNGTTIVLGPVDKVSHDQEVTRETHLQDDAQLKLQPLYIFWAACITNCFIRKQQHQPRIQPFVRSTAEVLLNRHGSRHREIGQIVSSQLEGYAAATCDFQGVLNRGGNIGKHGLHIGAVLEILLTGKAPHTLGIGQYFAFGNAHTGFMRLKVTWLGKLDRMRCHDR